MFEHTDKYDFICDIDVSHSDYFVVITVQQLQRSLSFPWVTSHFLEMSLKERTFNYGPVNSFDQISARSPSFQLIISNLIVFNLFFLNRGCTYLHGSKIKMLFLKSILWGVLVLPILICSSSPVHVLIFTNFCIFSQILCK